ncbi:HugZ family protein [Aliiruegeria haliotis]|nr:pyridoxamine 5'-phosphate oxidase family protein [Aliiruegeria haliotis]
MSEKKIDPIRPTDAEARSLAKELLRGAGFAALGVLDPETGSPMVTRVAIGTDFDGAPVTLVSSLSQHTTALRANAACSVLVGEPASKGDPLTHPRLTVQCKARFISREDPGHEPLRERWLAHHPKAKLYIDFGDFGFVRLEVERAFLNGGFGKAYVLTAADLGLTG